MCVMKAWLVPAPSRRTRTAAPVRLRDLERSAADRPEMWSAAVFDPAFPGLSSMATDSPVFAAPGPERVEAESGLVRAAAFSFLAAVRGDQRRVHIDHGPAPQDPARDLQRREPARPRRPIRSQTCARILALACAIFPSVTGSARSRVRRSSPARSPDRPAPGPDDPGPRSRSSTPPAQRDHHRRRHQRGNPRSTSGNLPSRSRAPLSAAVSPDRSAISRTMTPPACPTRPSPSAVTASPRSHRHILHREERSSSLEVTGVTPRNLPEPGRSSLLNRLSRPRRSRTRQVPHPCNRYRERIRETPAHRHAEFSSGLIQG